MSSSVSEENFFKISENFIIKLPNRRLDRKVCESCKILLIPADEDISQWLAIISNLNPRKYSNLFIFIIENVSNENQEDQMRQIEESLRNFGTTRPLIVLQIFEDGSESQMYHRAVKGNHFVAIDRHYPEDYKLYEYWKDALTIHSDRVMEPLPDLILKKLSCTKDSSMVLRFLRTFDLKKELYNLIILKVAQTGSKADLLAVLDASFEDGERILKQQAQDYIKNVYQDQSILMAAVDHSNNEIIDYLISFCTDLIQQLPVAHQINIATAAYSSNQLDVLSDLIKLSDFPFPRDLDDQMLDHVQLQNIFTDRMKFHKDIKNENFEEIKKFINTDQNFKFVYSPGNITAIMQAINYKKYKIYFYLKSYGLSATEFDDIEKVLDGNEPAEMEYHKGLQIKELTDEAIRDPNSTVSILCSKSRIHNRKVIEENKAIYREHIKEWLGDIYKVANVMLDVAATCEDLVIIFDFDSIYVDRTTFMDESYGQMYTTETSRIFIGAQLGSIERTEQDIKGTLAHELCHYVIYLVYKNNQLPYYKTATEQCQEFGEIVQFMDKWSADDSESPDDECNGIISTVFEYKEHSFELEMIVRAVQILTRYDDNPGHLKYLRGKYQALFNYWFSNVVPEMTKYLNRNKVAVGINLVAHLLPRLLNSKIEFYVVRDLKHLITEKVTIVTTNIPKLLLINIYQYLQEKCGCLLDSQNLFMDSKWIFNGQVWNNMHYLQNKDVNLNIFVDCSNSTPSQLICILKKPNLNVVLIASSHEHASRLKDTCAKVPTIKQLKTKVENYKWSDLAETSQTMLLQTKVKFQSTSELTLKELLTTNANRDESEDIDDFLNSIDNKLFNQLVNGQKISINSNVKVDISNEKFEILYQKRKFFKAGVGFKNEISMETLISIIAHNKFVLLSDIAGSGKSWVVRNIFKTIAKLDPTRWVTSVDLKQFIEEFKKQIEVHDFANYFIDKILKLQTRYEEDIFKKLYKNGKVTIIFDGFDEIAPKCAQYVANLAKKFDQNEGNQLWIVTRDFFEVDLQQELKIDDVYKLAELTEEEGINFIVASWILTDATDQGIKNLENWLKSSPNLTKYQNKASKIVKNVVMSKKQSIGLPQLFSMIAEAYKADKYKPGSLKGAKIFLKFVNKMYSRWADDKGKFNKKASVVSQHYKLGFMQFHQYCAISSMFPEFVDEFYPNYDEKEWHEEAISACGIMKKIRSFIHETFREFFVADFIFKNLKNPEITKLLIKVLTIHKYGIIRMFLNDFISLNDCALKLDTVRLELEKSVGQFQDTENLSEFFIENQEQLAKLVIVILKNGEYERVRKVLSDNIKDVATRTTDLGMFKMFTDFFFSFLTNEDLKDIINQQEILQSIIGSLLNVDIFEHFVAKVEERLGLEFVQQQLKMMPAGTENGNIFYHLATSQSLTQVKVHLFFEIIKNILDPSEISKLMVKCNASGHPVHKILVQNTSNIKPFLDGAEQFLKDPKSFEEFKNMVHKIDLNKEHILHWIADIDGIEFHTSIWKLVQATFDDYDKLKTFVLQKNNFENNFFHTQLIWNKAETIKFTLDHLKNIFSMFDYCEFLRIKGRYKRNLLQIAVTESKHVEIHQILWRELRESSQSDDEFMELIEEVDVNGGRVLNLAACFTTSEIFTFIEEQLADKFKHFLVKLGVSNRNILQAAVNQNKSVELHKTLWRILQKYLNSAEILEFVRFQNIYGYNILNDVIEDNTKEVAELTWMEVKEVLNSMSLITEEHEESIKKCDYIMRTTLGRDKLKIDEIELLKLKWIKSENLEVPKLFNGTGHEQNLTEFKLEHLKKFIADPKVENHEELWENLLKMFTNLADLKALMTDLDQSNFNYINLLVACNSADVIAFTLNKLKEVLDESDYREVLQFKIQLGRNLLHMAASNTKEVKTHQFLWKIFRESCKSEDEFLMIISECDENSDNVIGLAVGFSSEEVLSFMHEQLRSIESRDNVKKLLTNLGFVGRNLLQAAAEQNKSLEVHEAIWDIINHFFNPIDVLQFIKHCDAAGRNVLLTAINSNTKQVKKLIWRKVRQTLMTIGCRENHKFKEIDDIMESNKKLIDLTEEQAGDLKLNWIDLSGVPEIFEDIIQMLIQNKRSINSVNDLILFTKYKDVESHMILWEHLLRKDIRELNNLLLEKTKIGDNFVHIVVISTSADVTKLTIDRLKLIFDKKDCQKFLRSKGQIGRNLLHRAACASKDVKMYEVLCTELRDLCNSDEEFLEILEEVGSDGINVFHLAAAFSTSQVFDFMISKLKEFKNSREIITRVLKTFGCFNFNLLQTAAMYNKNLDSSQIIWSMICKYFDTEEILEFINHCDDVGDNLLSNVVHFNVKAIVEFTWNQIKIFIDKKEHQIEYLSRRGRNGNNLLQLAANNESNDADVAAWIEQIIQEYGITF